MKSFAIAAAMAACAGTASAAVTINEIRIDDPGTDDNEYFELAGTPGESLDGLFYITIGDGAGGSGVVENVTDLSGLSIPADGYFLAAAASHNINPGQVDLTFGLTFENSDNVTHLLVSGFTGASGDDLDTDDDGVLDTVPWASILDSIALLEEIGGGDLVYSPNTVGPDGTFVPGHIFRSPDGTGSWNIGAFDDQSPEASDTPGLANIPAPGSVALLGLAGFAAARRRRA